MRKIIFIGILIFISFKINAQMIVNDPTNQVQLVELVKNGAEQTEKINKQLDIIKEAKENLEVVNSYLKRTNTVTNALSQSKSIIENLNRTTKELSKLNNLSPRYFSSVINSMNGYYSALTQNVSNITSYLTDGHFKMSDAERLQLIDKELEGLRMIDNKIKRTYAEAYRINNMKNVIGRQ